jgi:hypothetical protein
MNWNRLVNYIGAGGYSETHMEQEHINIDELTDSKTIRSTSTSIERCIQKD